MKKLLIGNEAIARGAWEAGCTVVSSYPGTPSTEITEFISTYEDIYSEWAPNEKVAAEVAFGGSLGGARSMTAMKHVGMNVAADPLFTASYTGVNGGMVVVVADDPGMHSSQNEQDSRNYAKGAKLPMLEPADSQECKDFVKAAFALSETYDTPFMVRLSTRIAHSLTLVELGEKEEYKIKPYQKDVMKYVMMPGMAVKRHVVVCERMEKLKGYAENSHLNRIEWGDKKIGIVTSGISYQYTKEAVPGASVLKLGMVWPLPVRLIEEFAKEVDSLYVVEELEPFLEEHIKTLGIKVIGKEIFSRRGELSSQAVKEKILGMAAEEQTKIQESIPVRPPVMCPGCPHRGMFHVLKKLKLTVTGDIGCYTLGALSPTSSIDACLCMGASIGMAHGMEKAMGADAAKKTVAILGDSTFIHSGITGLIDVVYNKGNSTVIILDNSITGMTGHQQNPTTGLTIKNEPTRQVDLVKLAEAVGITRVVVCDPFDVKEFERIVKEEVAAGEPSVIISQRPCALLKSVKFDGTKRIVKEKCKKCKSCFRIGCPAIVLSDEDIVINESLCVGCGLCTKLCAFEAIEKNIL